MKQKKVVVIGWLGSTLDAGNTPGRHARWRPSVAVCAQEGLRVDRFELLYQPQFAPLLDTVRTDIAALCPHTEVRPHPIAVEDPWDFAEAYRIHHDFARAYPFDTEREDYLVHVTTGTHVFQYCLILLTSRRHFPARLLQTSPRGETGPVGSHAIIDLDLERYDRIAQCEQRERSDATCFLKYGIPTASTTFNRMIEQIERVAVNSPAPILLTGPTGAGKSRLARRIYELKKARRHVDGAFVEVNCATLRGDTAMSALFGHVRGAFTGAAASREGLLRTAHRGVLFLDEIAELGLDEQAMLLRALEEGRFLPVGSDRESESDFCLIAGTNRDLRDAVGGGRFREDLLARIDLWMFRLPGLAERPEDIEPNLDYEIGRFAQRAGFEPRFSREARRRFLSFATAPTSVWSANFRDLNAAVTRMGTLATNGRITVDDVEDEIGRLKAGWAANTPDRRDAHPEPTTNPADDPETELRAVLPAHRIDMIDRFDRVQLAEVLRVCRQSHSLSEAGRTLFGASRLDRTSRNDTDRVRKYLARYGIDGAQLLRPTHRSAA